MKRNILLNPGPGTTTDTVKMAQVVPDICPREEEFTQLMNEMRSQLVQIVHGNEKKYTAVLFCGSGTLNMDVCINSLVPPNKKILVINNGVYSARAVEICKCYGLNYVELNFAFDERPDIRRLEMMLEQDQEIAVVYATHNETGTGLLNPVRELGEIVHQYNGTFIVDTTSSYGMIPIHIEEDNIDFLMASAQKGLMAMTGLSFVIGNRKILERSAEYPPRSYYCNLYQQYLGFEKTGEMRFTPPVQTVYALKQAIKEYFEEGEIPKWERHQSVYRTLREGMLQMGFREVIKPEWQSGLVTTWRYPKDKAWNFSEVHDYCYEKGYTIYPGKISTADTFRLCALGALKAEDIKGFLIVFREALERLGLEVPVQS